MLAFAAAVVLATGACSGGNGPATDAAADLGSGGDAPADTTPVTCDPAAQDCASGSECDFGCDGTTAAVRCRADNGTVAIGGACSTTAMQCAKGSGCVARPTSGGAFCLKYCASDGDCATGERCHNDNVGVACGAPATTFLLHFCY